MSPGECRIDCLSGECCYLPLTSATLGCTPTCKATQPSAFPRGRCRAWVFDFVAVPFNCNYAASQIWETRLKNSCSKNTISFFHRKFFRPPLRVKYKFTYFWIKRLREKLFKKLKFQHRVQELRNLSITGRGGDSENNVNNYGHTLLND